jgi:hypothetical protein
MEGKLEMVGYSNLSGDSGVVAYAIGSDFSLVQFRNGGIYRYSAGSAGKLIIDRMKVLAASGRGLSTFIAKTQPAYEVQLD